MRRCREGASIRCRRRCRNRARSAGFSLPGRDARSAGLQACRGYMPKVTFIIDGEAQTVEFEHGKLPYTHHGKPESFLDVAKNFGVPLEHACGGSCACTTCHVIIRQGANNLSEMQ